MSSAYIDTAAAAAEHCEAMSTLYPDLADRYNRLSSLTTRKLWHQLTVEVLEFVSTPAATLRATADGGNSYLALYDKVVLPVDKKMNQLSLARTAAAVSWSLLDSPASDGVAARAVLENLLEKKGRLGAAATLYAESKLALLHLELYRRSGSDSTDTKLLASTKETLERNAGPLAELAESTESDVATVHSSYYECSMTYRKAVGPPEAFYREAVQYLNYTPLDSLPKPQREALATDLSVAALTGDGVYNFGEVVQSPILACLQDTPHAWLVQLMKVAAAGDVQAFETLSTTHAKDIASHAALVARADTVQEKMTLLALVGMVFERPSSERTLKFDDIAERIRVAPKQVEVVLMRALSLGLLKGTMDQVDGTVTVTWIMPRVLEKNALLDLATRFEEWAEKVGKIRQFVGEETPTMA